MRYGATAAWRGSLSTLSRCVGRCFQRQRPAPRRNRRQDKRGPTGVTGAPPHQSWRFSVLVVGAFLFPISLPKVAELLGSSAFAQASGTGCLRKHRMTSWPSVGRRHGGLLGDWRTGDCGGRGRACESWFVGRAAGGGRTAGVGRRGRFGRRPEQGSGWLALPAAWAGGEWRGLGRAGASRAQVGVRM